MPKYPKINYIGNKEKIVDWIIDEFPIKKGIVLDLFSGGCSVSYALKERGYSVISNDILYADYVLAKAIVENDDCQINSSVFDLSINSNDVALIKEKISFLVNKLYFEYEVDELAELITISNRLRGYQRYLFLALLRRSMIRKLPYSRMNVPWNQIQKLRNEEYSYKLYGRKRAYHNISFKEHILDNIESYNSAVFYKNKCIALNMDALSVIEKITYVDVVYLDPPYPSTMNNYDSFYGVFDEIFDEKKDHIDFTKKMSFLENLEKIIRALIGKTGYIVLSQNTKVKPSPNEIMQLLHKYGSVELKEKKHIYQVTGKLNKRDSKELLFILKIK